MNIKLKLWNIVIKYNDRNDFMELNYLKDMADEILEYGNIQFLKPLTVSEAVYLKKVLKDMYKVRGSSTISLANALSIVDVNTEKEEYSYQSNEDSKQINNKIDVNDEYVKMASDILIGKSLGLLKPLEEDEALKIVEAAKLLIEANGQICYKRGLQGVIDYVNKELGNGKKIAINFIDDEEVFELIDDYDLIPIWDIDEIIDPMLISNPSVTELARILVATGDLGLLNPLRIDYSLAIIRECIMLLSDSSSEININNLIFYLNLNTDGNYRIEYTKYSAKELKSMIIARKELVVDPKVIKDIEKRIKSGELNISSMKK